MEIVTVGICKLPDPVDDNETCGPAEWLARFMFGFGRMLFVFPLSRIECIVPFQLVRFKYRKPRRTFSHAPSLVIDRSGFSSFQEGLVIVISSIWTSPWALSSVVPVTRARD